MCLGVLTEVNLARTPAGTTSTVTFDLPSTGELRRRACARNPGHAPAEASALFAGYTCPASWSLLGGPTQTAPPGTATPTTAAPTPQPTVAPTSLAPTEEPTNTAPPTAVPSLAPAPIPTESPTPIVEALNPAEDQRSYSSVFDNDAVGTGHARSMLDSDQAWSAAQNTVGQYMTISIGSAQTVAGVVTQGRKGNSQWVQSFKVQTSLENCSSYSDVDQGRVFTANVDQNSKVRAFFTTPVQASCVRLLPQSWYGSMSMRAAALLLAALSPTAPPAAGRRLLETPSYYFKGDRGNSKCWSGSDIGSVEQCSAAARYLNITFVPIDPSKDDPTGCYYRDGCCTDSSSCCTTNGVYFNPTQAGDKDSAATPICASTASPTPLPTQSPSPAPSPAPTFIPTFGALTGLKVSVNGSTVKVQPKGQSWDGRRVAFQCLKRTRSQPLKPIGALLICRAAYYPHTM